MYDDAFTVQFVNAESVENFNYVSGMVPFILNLLQQVRWVPEVPDVSVISKKGPDSHAEIIIINVTKKLDT